MLVIRTAEEMARALDSPLEPKLKRLLRTHWENLSEYDGYDLAELALFIIAQPGDGLAEIQSACPMQLLDMGGGEAIFAILPELARQHSNWIELTFIFSDFGEGLVLFVELGEGADPLLLAACKDALEHLDSIAAPNAN